MSRNEHLTKAGKSGKVRTNPNKDFTPVNDGGHYDKGYTGAASDKYRDGWDAIDWSIPQETKCQEPTDQEKRLARQQEIQLNGGHCFARPTVEAIKAMAEDYPFETTYQIAVRLHCGLQRVHRVLRRAAGK